MVSDEYGDKGGDDCEDDAYLKNPLTTIRTALRPSMRQAPKALKTRDNSMGGARDDAAVAVVVAVLA